jgi:hypothetical protein
MACQYIEEARDLRKKYFGASQKSEDVSFQNIKQVLDSDANVEYSFGAGGVVELYSEFDTAEHALDNDSQRTNLCPVPNVAEFVKDYKRLVHIASDGAMRSYSFQRLQMLSAAFKMHVTGKCGSFAMP